MHQRCAGEVLGEEPAIDFHMDSIQRPKVARLGNPAMVVAVSPFQHRATRRASACIAAQKHSRVRDFPMQCSEQRRGAEGQQADYLFQSLDGFPWERCTEQEGGEHFCSSSSVIGIARLQQIDKLLIHPPPPVKSLTSPRPWAPRAPGFVETPLLPRAP